MIKAGIIGGSGYAGQNVIKLLKNHPQVEISAVISTSSVDEVETITGLKYSKFDPNEINQLDVVFLAVPHGAAKEIVKSITCRIIDISADHRDTHTYGLPEIYTDIIKDSSLIANPGCYASACILSVYPIKELIKYVVFDCISGYSGAGKNAKEKFDFDENIIVYELTNHFHIKEIEKTLGISVSFTPHVVNVFAGLMCTAHIFLKEDTDISNIKQTYKNFYKDSFTKIVDALPTSKDVVNTPYCHIGGFQTDKNSQLVLVSVIDNLMKGAASQAIENMNIMFGLNHSEGLC